MEARNTILENRVLRLESELRRLRVGDGHTDCPGADACELELPPRRVLYLGGRPSALDQLKAIAELRNTEVLHHDGGQEQTVELIDGLVTRCDAVFCPVDCVSHGACERAKLLCRKLSKRFVPLRSSGVTTFKRALMQFETR